MRFDRTRSATEMVVNDCHLSAAQLSEFVDGGECLDPSALDHFGCCLRCQAELAQYKKLLRALSNLRGQVIAPDDFLLQDVLNALDRAGEGWSRHLAVLNERPGFLRGTGAIAATAGAAACTAGAIVLANRLTARQRLAG